MNDYMKALRKMFMDSSRYSKERQELEDCRQALVSQLNVSQRDLLMDLVDSESLLRVRMAVENFVSGFRLAYGIAKELSVEPPYSFNSE